MQWIYHPSIHYFMTLVHITSALFWLGWMVYVSMFVVPLLKSHVPEKFYELRARLQSRTRSVVGVLIILILLTGLYNMGYRGLFNLQVLFASPYGLRFVLKVFLALVLFGFYLAAPVFSEEVEGRGSGEVSGPVKAESQSARTVFMIVHSVALALGLAVAYLGISLGG